MKVDWNDPLLLPNKQRITLQDDNGHLNITIDIPGLEGRTIIILDQNGVICYACTPAYHTSI